MNEWRSFILPLVLLTLLAQVMSASVVSAGWLPSHAGLLVAIWGGLTCGVLLTAVRWHPGWAGAYAAALNLLVMLLALARPLPPGWVSAPLLETITAMQPRLLAFFERAALWGRLLRAGEPVADTGLFVLTAGVLAWQAYALLGFMTLRARHVLGGLVLPALLLGLNAHFGRQDPAFLLLFSLGSLGLVANSAYRGYQRAWRRQQLDTAWEMGDWALSAALILLLLGAFIRLAPVVATPSGWQRLSELAQSTRDRAAETTGRLFPQVQPPAVTGLPTDPLPDLSRVGLPLNQSQAVILRVRTSDPPPLSERFGGSSAAPVHYWRSQVFDTYTGSGWVAAETANTPLNLADTLPPAGRYRLVQQYTLALPAGGNLFAVNQPFRAGALVKIVGVGPDASPLVAAADAPVQTYTVESWAVQADGAGLQSAGTSYPPGLVETYLQLPPDVPQRVLDLAASLTAGAATPFEKALVIQDELRRYQYDPEVPLPLAGADVVDYFLFEAKRGFCSYYATAMAVMLRAQGVPARVATGYATGVYDSASGEYLVPVSAAHAWAEVYFPGYGWVEFEPTAAFSRRVYPNSPPVAPPAAVLPLEQPGAAPGWRNWLPPAGIAMAGILLMALLATWTKRERRWRDPATGAALLYQGALDWLRRRGLSLPPGATPAEVLAAARVRYPASTPLNGILSKIFWLYELSAFSPHPPPPQDVRAARRAWTRLRLRRLFNLPEPAPPRKR